MNIVLFEDDRVEQLFPITIARPAYTICCGAYTLLELAGYIDGSMHGRVRPYLTTSQEDYFPHVEPTPNASTLWLNARLVPDASLLKQLAPLIDKGKPFSCIRDSQVLVAITSHGESRGLDLPAQAINGWLTELDLPSQDLDAKLLDLPHSVIAEHARIMKHNVVARVEMEQFEEIFPGVYVADGSNVHEQVAFDSNAGPIVIDKDANVGPFAVLRGPIYIGKRTSVVPHALLKGPVSVGHACKVGGEISSSIIEPYTNKTHFGYLGTSYVGSWVNLGAGTTNSNLKNTYGTVRVQYESGKFETGMQFLGCVIGDYSKTAIHTSIYTGKLIGVCSNIYGTVTGNVPSFANYAKSLGEVTEHSAEVMEVTQKRVFERRGIEQLESHRQLIRAMYEIEAPKRKLANKPPSL